MDLLSDWVAFLLRWTHLLAGITWIGTSFYFNWFDLSLRKPLGSDNKENIRGALTEVHGGNFYYHEQYWPDTDVERTLHHGGPAQLTLATGLALMALVYWLGARSYLIDPRVLELNPLTAVLISAGSLMLGWVLYHQLCLRVTNERIVLTVLVVVVAMAGWSYLQLFSARAATLHVGALLGTIMVMNVIAVIIPGHISMRRQLQQGETLDRTPGENAKRRSQHNNYFTLPVLAAMVGVHFSAAYSGAFNWVVLPLIMLSGVAFRHYRNIQLEKETNHRGFLTIAIALLTTAVALTAIPSYYASIGETQPEAISDSQMQRLVRTHCTSCHAEIPKDRAFSAPPAGMILETLDDVRLKRDLIYQQTIVNPVMPLGNKAGMTDQDRAMFGQWLKTSSTN